MSTDPELGSEASTPALVRGLGAWDAALLTIGTIIGTGIFVSPALGGVGVDGYTMGGQVMTQATGVLITIVWSGVVSFVAFKLVDMTIGLRVSEEQEREGLDTASHGERAYNV